MKLIDLVDLLSRTGDKPVNLWFNDQQAPAHYHLTEVGLVTKKFVDCGGNARERVHCALQVWVADDVDHRLSAKKFLDILRIGMKFIPPECNVVFEYQKETIGLFPLRSGVLHSDALNLTAGLVYTTCLAPDKCGVKGCC